MGLVVSGLVLPLLVFLLVRDGGPLNPEEPAALGGAITSVDIERLNPCCAFAVNFTLEGFKGQTTTIHAVVTDAVTGARGQSAPVITAVPEADRDNAAFTAEVPLGGYPGSYVVTFVLYAPNGTELDRMDSELITVY